MESVYEVFDFVEINLQGFHVTKIKSTCVYLRVSKCMHTIDKYPPRNQITYIYSNNKINCSLYNI